MTRSSAILEVSKKTYEEIAEKLRAAGYDHVFLQGRYGPEHIDLNGIMIRREQPAFDHSKRTTKYHEPTLGFCICEHCEKLPDNEPPTVAGLMAKAKAAGHDSLGVANDPEWKKPKGWCDACNCVPCRCEQRA